MAMHWLQSILISLIDLLYIPQIKSCISRDMFGYGLCGAMNMALDAMWYFLIYHFIIAESFINLGFVVVSPHIASLIIVFPITFCTGFWLNRNVAFRVTHLDSHRQLLRYALSVIGSLLINYLCMKFFVESLGIWPTPSKMFTTIISAIYSFLAAKFYTFKK